MSSLNNFCLIFATWRATWPLWIITKLRRLLLNLQSKLRGILIKQSLAEGVIDRNTLTINWDHHRYYICIRKIFSTVYIMIFRRTWCQRIRLLWLSCFYFFVWINLTRTNWFKYLLSWLTMRHYHLHNTLYSILIYLFATFNFNHPYPSWIGTYLIISQMLWVIILRIFFRFLWSRSWNLHTIDSILLKYKFKWLLLSIFLMRCARWCLNTCTGYLLICVYLFSLRIGRKNQTIS